VHFECLFVRPQADERTVQMSEQIEAEGIEYAARALTLDVPPALHDIDSNDQDR